MSKFVKDASEYFTNLKKDIMGDIDYSNLNFKQLLKYAGKGDEWAQYLVGLEYCYPENDGEEDPEEAVKWFRKASEAGVPEASFELAQKMYLGDGTEEDTKGAYDLALKTAEEADLPEAWALLGFMYGYGDPVEEDMDKCRELIEKGASMGSDYASSLLEQLEDGTLFGEDDDEDDDDEDEDEEDDDDYDDDDEDEEDEEDEEEVVENHHDGTDGYPDDNYAIDVDMVTGEARHGNVQAMKTLAWGYENGLYGLGQDTDKALKWYDKAADEDDLWALRQYGRLQSEQGNGRKALKAFERGIKKGDGGSCELAGDLYFSGKAGIEKDQSKAFDYYLKGYNLNHGGCTASLGRAYYYANGARQNLEQAERMYIKAAELGVLWGWKMAGLSAERRRDFARARKIYQEGMDHGNWLCACMLGNLYRKGRFGESNFEKALDCYRDAIDHGQAEGYACLGEIFHEMQDTENARTVFSNGAEAGNANCKAWLGRMDVDDGDISGGLATIKEAIGDGSNLGNLFMGDYHYGRNEYSTAFGYYQKAANSNVGPALLRMGMMYFDGQGIRQSNTNAKIFLQYAWELGEDMAEKPLGIMKKYGY